MVKHEIQKEKNECGIACIKMFYNFLNLDVNYYEIKENLILDNKGISIEEMLKELNKIGTFKAFDIKKEELKDHLPAIAIFSKKKRNHYVVIWKYIEGYYYVSDPSYTSIKKVMEKKVLNLFSGYIIFSNKREVEIKEEKYLKVKKSKFRFPYIFLSILEVLLLTYSMLYLFSIKDFTVFKVYYFLIILFLNCIISIIKNLCFNHIQKHMDKNTIDYKINKDFVNGKINSISSLKKNIQKGYQIKGDYTKLYKSIIPEIFIILGTIIYFYLINVSIFIFGIIIFILLFIINFCFALKKKKYIYLASLEEEKIDEFDNKMLSKGNKDIIVSYLDNIKENTSKYLILSQSNSLVNFAIKQFGVMLLLMFMYMSKINIYSIFVITFYFYSFDGIIEVSDYFVRYKERKNLNKDFLSE